MWNVEELALLWLGQGSPEQRPQFSKDTEERGLSAAVGSTHEHVHAVTDFEAQLLDEDVSVGGDERHSVELDDLVLDDETTGAGDQRQTGSPPRTVSVSCGGSDYYYGGFNVRAAY